MISLVLIDNVKKFFSRCEIWRCSIKEVLTLVYIRSIHCWHLYIRRNNHNHRPTYLPGCTVCSCKYTSLKRKPQNKNYLPPVRLYTSLCQYFDTLQRYLTLSRNFYVARDYRATGCLETTRDYRTTRDLDVTRYYWATGNLEIQGIPQI